MLEFIITKTNSYRKRAGRLTGAFGSSSVKGWSSSGGWSFRASVLQESHVVGEPGQLLLVRNQGHRRRICRAHRRF